MIDRKKSPGSPAYTNNSIHKGENKTTESLTSPTNRVADSNLDLKQLKSPDGSHTVGQRRIVNRFLRSLRAHFPALPRKKTVIIIMTIGRPFHLVEIPDPSSFFFFFLCAHLAKLLIPRTPHFHSHSSSCSIRSRAAVPEGPAGQWIHHRPVFYFGRWLDVL